MARFCCAPGLHFGSVYYAESYGNDDDAAIIVKIDPADVVSIPKNDCEKGRCCGYEVVDLFQGRFENPVEDV